MIRAALIALALAGCSRSHRSRTDDGPSAVRDGAAPIDAPPMREIVILRQVEVDVVAPGAQHQAGKDAVVARLRRLGPGVVDVPAGVPKGWAGRGGTIHAVLTYDRGGTAKAPSILMTAEVALDLDGDALGAAARAAGEARVDASGEAATVDALAATLVDQVATELTAKLTLRAGTSADLVAAVNGDDPEAAAWALELGGERGDPALKDAALEDLKGSVRARTAAIQYLVALGDPSTVPALTATVDFADRDQLAAIIEAVTAIGGQDARDFLDMLSAGATDSETMDRAKDGLRRLDKREDAGP
jgi:hypothetical protein